MLRLDRWSWMILVVAFAIRLGAALEWQSLADRESTLFRFGDSDSYWVLANRIAHGENFEYGGENSRIFRAPLYPIALAPWTFLGDERTSVLGARIFGALLGTVCVWLVMVTSTSIGGVNAGRWGGLLATFYPGAIGMSIFILSEALFCPLILASLLLWYLSLAPQRNAGSKPLLSHFDFSIFLSGALSGAAALARPSWILWPGCLALLLAIQRDKRSIQIFATFLMGMILVLSPWWTRNYLITGEFVPTTLQVGASLYDGWHAGASGSSDEGMLFSEEFAARQIEEDRTAREEGRELRSTMEYRLDQSLRRAAISWASENPSDVARLGVIKWAKTWSPWPTAGQVGNVWLRLSESVAYLFILLFGCLGWLGMRRQVHGISIFVVPCFYYAVLHTVFVGSIRYRQPAILVLCIVGGVGVAIALNWIRSSFGPKSQTDTQT